IDLSSSSVSDLRAITTNITSTSVATARITTVSLVRAQTATNNASASAFSIDTLVNFWAEPQTLGGTANYSVYAPQGLSVFGQLSIATTTRSLMSITQGTFTQTVLDPAVYIAPQPRSNWTMGSEGLYVQHRLSGAPGAAGAFVHDGVAAEINMTSS